MLSEEGRGAGGMTRRADTAGHARPMVTWAAPIVVLLTPKSLNS